MKPSSIGNQLSDETEKFLGTSPDTTCEPPDSAGYYESYDMTTDEQIDGCNASGDSGNVGQEQQISKGVPLDEANCHRLDSILEHDAVSRRSSSSSETSSEKGCARKVKACLVGIVR